MNQAHTTIIKAVFPKSAVDHKTCWNQWILKWQIYSIGLWFFYNMFSLPTRHILTLGQDHWSIIEISGHDPLASFVFFRYAGSSI